MVILSGTGQCRLHERTGPAGAVFARPEQSGQIKKTAFILMKLIEIFLVMPAIPAVNMLSPVVNILKKIRS